jgi:molecular chaperone DnaK
MLGGKDFDQLLVAEVVIPWMEAQFNLADGYRSNPAYLRLLKSIKWKVEDAKT